MFGNMKRLRENIVHTVSQLVELVAHGQQLHSALVAKTQADRDAAIATAEAAFAKKENAIREQRQELAAQVKQVLDAIQRKAPLSGLDYANALWKRPEWSAWNTTDNRGLKPEDRKNIPREFFQSVFSQENRLTDYVLFGSAHPHPSAPQIPLFFSPSRHHNLVITTQNPDKSTAYDFMYSLTLRLLTAGRPGSVNLLMIDPVKLGEKLGTFSTAFRELPRIKSLIQGGLALTEDRQIEDELVQLRTRIAEIVQTMGDNYASLEAYNQASNDIQEPYRILVIRDFPKSFSKNSVDKLVSIMSSGPKCGVYTILHIDESVTRSDPNLVARGQQLSPAELVEHYYKSKFDIGRNQLVAGGILLEQINDTPEFFRMSLSDEIQQNVSTTVTTYLLDTLAEVPVKLLDLPASDIATNVVNSIATLHAQGDTVAIPIPEVPAAQWWKGQSTQALSVDVGTASRADKMIFELSDAVVNGLIVGRIGSGKTNLLHVIIQQLCTRYSPAELVLYLIDLKQAEFHSYGHNKLPHARVVASKTDRAFCLNVLQDVHLEVERRNAMFTQAANEHRKTIVNLAQYRDVTGHALPQLVLIADEFTVLFSIDDKITAEARRLIEQIAKLGRSSGIHLILATQALQHSTLSASIRDQFVMRIALMCDDNTIETLFGAHNKLARTLKRRGEAIFNYAAGSEDGNRRAQVYIQHADTPKFIGALRTHAANTATDIRTPMVFEGNITSSVADHPLYVTSKPGSAIRGRDLKCYFGQELTLANAHVSTALSDATADNVIIMAAKSYEKYVSEFLLSLLSLFPKQFQSDVLHLNVSDSTYSADTDTWRIAPFLHSISDSINDVRDSCLEEIVRLADLIYSREQSGAPPSSIEVFVCAGIPRNLQNPVRQAQRTAAQLSNPAVQTQAHQQPAPTAIDTPFPPDSEEAAKRRAIIAEIMGNMSPATAESLAVKSPVPRTPDAPAATLLNAFRLGYGGEQITKATSSPAVDMSGAPSRQNTTYSKLLAYILENGPAMRVHTILWMDGLNTLQNTLGSSRTVVDQLFNTRVLFPMSMNDASRFCESDAKAVDAFQPINQLGNWNEPRVLIYDRAQNVATIVRPYGAFTELESHVL